MVDRARPYLVVVFFVWVLPAALFAVAAQIAPRGIAGGGCSGIGWGCSLSPHDVVLLCALLSSYLLFPAGLVALLIVEIRLYRRRKRAARLLREHR